jgi:outer membrane immunogenic protein
MRLFGAFVAASVCAAAVCGTAAQAAEPNWSGAYAGFHAGYGKGEISDASAFDIKGFVGGGHIGYNMQYNQLVLGVEGDVSFATLKDELTFTSGGVKVTGGIENTMLASIRGRAGLSLGSAMIYGTAGLAFANLKASATATNGVLSASASDSITERGFVFGGGLQYMFSPKLVGRIEGLRYQFNDLDGSSSSYRADTIRAGLSFRF